MHKILLVFVFLFSASSALKITNKELLLRLYGCMYDDVGKQTETNTNIPEWSTSELVRKNQKSVGLEATGVLGSITIRAMLTSRCDTGRIFVPAHSPRRKRYVIQGSKWYRKDLKYKIITYPRNLNKEDVEQVMRNAFDEWSNYTDLTFTRTNDPNEADIKIEFSTQHHKDGWAFGGPDPLLAHGYFPDYGGDIHFDKEEIWSLDEPPKKGYNLYHVALHEIGHSLGLEHSAAVWAVMYAYELNGVTDFHLTPDDINAIQALYGQKTTATVSSQEYLCKDPKIDAVLTGRDGKVYMLKDQYYWELDLNAEDKFPSTPKRIQDKWPGLRGNIDAAFTDNLSRTFFFKKSQCYAYRGNRLEWETLKRIDNAFPKIPSYLDAAFSKPGHLNELYFFKKGQFYKYVRAKYPHVDGSYPRNITEKWADVPSELDAALRLNNTIYFFKGNYYYSVKDEDINDSTKPLKTIKNMWLDCRKYHTMNS